MLICEEMQCLVSNHYMVEKYLETLYKGQQARGTNISHESSIKMTKYEASQL